jgi:hypothetical protein
MTSAVKELTEKIKNGKERHQSQPITCSPGTFWCDGHLEFLPLEKQSRDKRYCIECLAAIEDSAPQADSGYWIKDVFITGGKAYGLTPDLKTVVVGTEAEVLARTRQKAPAATDTTANKALKNSQTTNTTTPRNVTAAKTTSKPIRKALQKSPPGDITIGRPKKELPVNRIMRLHLKGLGARAIAKELERDGIEVSYLTVHRLIKGQLALMPLGET